MLTEEEKKMEFENNPQIYLIRLLTGIGIDEEGKIEIGGENENVIVYDITPSDGMNFYQIVMPRNSIEKDQTDVLYVFGLTPMVDYGNKASEFLADEYEKIMERKR